MKKLPKIDQLVIAAVVRKIVASSRPPRISFLVVQKEAAAEFTGVPRSTQFVVWNFRRSDFFPMPKVEAVLLAITKREKPLVEDKQNYFNFVERGFNRIKPLFTYHQWRRLGRELKFSLPARPGELSLAQWLGLYRFYEMVK